MEINNEEIEIVKNETEIGNQNKNLVHPLSALFTLLVDLVFFGGDTLTMGLDLPVSVTLAFIVTFVIAFVIQKKRVGDNFIAALTKSVILAILAAIPTPIAGTFAGTVLLSIAGLKKSKK